MGRPGLQYLEQVARNIGADSYIAMERMACNNSRWNAANQSKVRRIRRRIIGITEARYVYPLKCKSVSQCGLITVNEAGSPAGNERDSYTLTDRIRDHCTGLEHGTFDWNIGFSLQDRKYANKTG